VMAEGDLLAKAFHDIPVCLTMRSRSDSTIP
ncbi:MAG: hypothetical protein ACI9MJ_001690, partial [Alphaproteobacteria bacterium]